MWMCFVIRGVCKDLFTCSKTIIMKRYILTFDQKFLKIISLIILLLSFSVYSKNASTDCINTCSENEFKDCQVEDTPGFYVILNKGLNSSLTLEEVIKQEQLCGKVELKKFCKYDLRLELDDNYTEDLPIYEKFMVEIGFEDSIRAKQTFSLLKNPTLVYDTEGYGNYTCTVRSDNLYNDHEFKSLKNQMQELNIKYQGIDKVDMTQILFFARCVKQDVANDIASDLKSNGIDCKVVELQYIEVDL